MNFKPIASFQRRKSYYISRLKEYKKRERRMSYGKDNPGMTFYVVGFDYDTQGLFAIVKSVLSHIMYGVDKGWIPVVDLKNYKCQYHKEGENAWELFFQQPCGYTLDDIQRSKHVVRSYYGMYPYNSYDFYVDVLDRPEECKRIAEAYKKYIKPQPKVMEYMEKAKRDLHIDNKTLGVLCRGTDYLNRKPKYHPKQPKPEIIINDACLIMEQKGYDSLFVATEDEQVLDMFKKRFGDKIRYINQPRITLEDNQQYLTDVKTGIDIRNRIALDYYTALYILSHCPAILAGRTAGTLGAVFMSEGYEWEKFYDLGYYY